MHSICQAAGQFQLSSAVIYDGPASALMPQSECPSRTTCHAVTEPAKEATRPRRLGHEVGTVERALDERHLDVPLIHVVAGSAQSTNAGRERRSTSGPWPRNSLGRCNGRITIDAFRPAHRAHLGTAALTPRSSPSTALSHPATRDAQGSRLLGRGSARERH